MKELPRKKSPSLKTITKNEDKTMDRNNGLEAKVSREETRTTITIDSGGIPPLASRVSLQDPTSPMTTITRTIEDHMTNAQINHSLEMTEIDLGMDLSTTRMGTGKTKEIFLVLHLLKEETSHEITPIANQEVINLLTLRSADLVTDLRLVLHPMNKNFRRAIIRHHLMWFASEQPMIPLTNCRISAR